MAGDDLQLAGAHVLAGAYRGKDVGERSTLCHAVSGRSIDDGRFKRLAGEAFCNRKIDVVDPYGQVDASEIDCPKCLDVVDRLRARGGVQPPKKTTKQINVEIDEALASTRSTRRRTASTGN